MRSMPEAVRSIDRLGGIGLDHDKIVLASKLKRLTNASSAASAHKDRSAVLKGERQDA